MLVPVVLVATISSLLTGIQGMVVGRQPPSLTVTTSNGPITGHPASNISSVIEYLGIPYAQPPVGDLRFAAPVPYAGYQAQNASTWGYDCPFTESGPSTYPGLTPQAQRILDYFVSGSGTPQSEDCLTLNIWRPAGAATAASLRPVLIFFYGGYFTVGHTNTPFYNGQFLADAGDVVVVTLNYRTNIFGFSGAPGEAAQNVGLRDQRLAVEWVRDNIHDFGGNPSKLTLFVQSAGGASVGYWSYAYAADPIAHGLISESGNALSFATARADDAARNWYDVAARLGCGGPPSSSFSSGGTDDDDDAAILACMRARNWTDVKAAAAEVPGSPSGSPLRSNPAFGPTVDGTIVFENYTALSEAGAFARVPYLLGNNNNEQGFYTISAYAQGINTTAAQGEAFLLSSFTCPNAFEAAARGARGVPVWTYRYFGDWHNLRLYRGSGAYHGTELEMVFGNGAQVSGLPASAAEKATTALVQKAWAAFADDPADGLAVRMGWPRYEDPDSDSDPAGGESLVRLAYDNNPVPDFVHPGVYDAPCSTVPLGATQTATAASVFVST